MQALLTSLLLPPLLLVLACGLGGLLAWRGWRRAGLLAALAAALQLLLATPFLSDALLGSLEGAAQASTGAEGAIIVLGAEAVRAATGLEAGPLTLERLRAGAALHRATGLPILVTAGPLSRGEAPLGPVMARSLAEDFRVPVRWVEAQARDTRDNAALGAAMLREAGIARAYLVTHGWHMARAEEAFARLGFAITAAPVHAPPPAAARFGLDWVPRPDHLAMSWFALREWAGRLVYAIRD